MQKTIKRSVKIEGIGLHTGCRVSLELSPAPIGTGIVFRRSDLQGFEIPALRKYVSRVVLATTLMRRGVMLSTVEHLLSAVYGLSIDNLYVDIDSLEVPILDGSALGFVRLLEEAGAVEQEAERELLVNVRPFCLEDGDKFIRVEPSRSFRVTYEIDFSHPSIGRQLLDLEVTPESYTREVAFARTFGFYSEVQELLKNGLIRGGSLENAVVLGETGIMNGSLRAEDEFVRHKVLDLIGDISLSGFQVIAHIRAYKAGHALHTRLAAELVRNTSACRRVSERRLAAGELSPAVSPSLS